MIRVGVGLPTSTPGAGRDLVLEWARRADGGPFSSLGVIDRLVYECWEPLASLAACAAITRRTRLVTMVVIGPLRRTALQPEKIERLVEILEEKMRRASADDGLFRISTLADFEGTEVDTPRTDRCTHDFKMTSRFQLRATHAPVRRRSSCSR